MLQIRIAVESDLVEITEIYNEAILNTTGTFDTEIKNVAEQEGWFKNREYEHPVLVAEIEGVIAGWASLNKYSDRFAYRQTAENSLYIKKAYQGQGVGKALLKSVLEEGQKRGLHTVLARITEGNEVSIRLHESEGFVLVGTMKEVGKKFDRLLDVHLLQKVFS